MTPAWAPAVTAAFEALDSRDRLIVSERGFNACEDGSPGATLEQLGIALGGISRERVRQLEQRAWRRLLRFAEAAMR